MAYNIFENLPENEKAGIIESGIKIFATKPYAKVDILDIERNCPISSDTLAEYFGSKHDFYLYCLNNALEKVFEEEPELTSSNLYGIVISAIDKKLLRCSDHYDEVRFIHMAARETDSEVLKGKSVVFSKYCEKLPASTSEVIARSAKNLTFNEPCDRLVSEAMSLYINSIINKFILQYQEKPDELMKNTGRMKEEISHYVDYMLYNLVKGDMV